MIEIFYVEDYMNGKVLEDRYFSDKEDAIKLRNKLGYGFVKSWKRRDDNSFYEESAGRKVIVFTNPE